MNFNNLIHVITETDTALKRKAYSAINQTLTIRNWLTGFYIVEFEQNGEDRAKYGKKLISSLAVELKIKQLKGYSSTYLKIYRQFYIMYPQIRMLMTSKLRQQQIGQTLSDLSSIVLNNNIIQISQTLSDLFRNTNISKNIEKSYNLKPDLLIERLSFSHFIELVKITDSLKRAFYEIECISGNWSVRELQRQTGSLLFERTGLSVNKEKLLQLTNSKVQTHLPGDIIRDPYIFEFLGLKQQEVFTENKLEDLLIKNLFISEYKLNLPSEKELKQFIESKKELLESLKQKI